MQEAHAKYLKAKNNLKFEVVSFSQEDNHIIDGLLVANREWHPIINGIPRLLWGELKIDLLQKHHNFLGRYRNKLPDYIFSEWQSAVAAISDLDAFDQHQKKTGESFAFEWRHIYRENDFERNNFLHFIDPFLSAADLKDKLIVDAGCGSGRFTKQIAQLDAKIAFGTDVGETVEVAFDFTRHLPNACIVQCDIYDMPFGPVMDLVLSIGVLHHLPRPQEGFQSLPKILNQNGRLSIWVYNRRHNARALYFYEPVRTITRRMPKKLLRYFCYVPAVVVHLFNQITLLLKEWGADRLSKKVPFFYYANFPFNMKLNDSFDVLATPKSNYYFTENIERWYKEALLKKFRCFEHAESGITAIGSK